MPCSVRGVERSLSYNLQFNFKTHWVLRNAVSLSLCLSQGRIFSQTEVTTAFATFYYSELNIESKTFARFYIRRFFI